MAGWVCGGIGLLLGLCMSHGLHSGAANGEPRGSSPVAGTQFAIADLDGDAKPDVASVEVEKQQTSSTSYAVRLQFGTGIGSYIGVDGPLGGLRVALRDVNGDESLDLVLTSTLNHRVIKVLLNDGHGNFSPAGAEVNALVKQDADTYVGENPPQFWGGTRFTTSRSWSEPNRQCVGDAKATSDEALIAGEFAVRTDGALRSCQGRAPPTANLPS